MLSRLKNELFRNLPQLGVIIAGVLVFGDFVQIKVQLYQLSMVALVLMFAHITRHSMFPYLKIEGLVGKARETSGGSAIVFAGSILLLCSILFVSVVR